MADVLETVEVTHGTDVDAAVIFLHGLGADGHDFEPIVPELRLGAMGVRFVFPHAPVRPVTINGGMAMRAWYDILSLDRNGLQDEAGVRDSEAHVRALMQREFDRGIRPERLVLAGFSQGGAIALHTFLRTEEKLAGVMALSTYLPLHDKAGNEATDSNRATPVFMAHGAFDPVLPITLGQASNTWMQQMGYAVEWKDYPMPHSVCPEEIRDMGAWFRKVFAK
ncbi:alpha/beta hydrolase [Acanthopleuribacter pedis]|uniref:Alpha/beta fold hydrolase n=1 Tax=Acanthopleuribacter pedis TaxID=442870 RepID=A0A8J7QBS3_9BACT|nr:alpha/beta fold hydrolase [Acanthopleuribacter pedis]MBO1323227.1 alpha/beta fold hydrolase [Acanthopleuribacter pedis]